MMNVSITDDFESQVRVNWCPARYTWNQMAVNSCLRNNLYHMPQGSIMWGKTAISDQL